MVSPDPLGNVTAHLRTGDAGPPHLVGRGVCGLRSCGWAGLLGSRGERPPVLVDPALD
jgi:hypothetical protein